MGTPTFHKKRLVILLNVILFSSVSVTTSIKAEALLNRQSFADYFSQHGAIAMPSQGIELSDTVEQEVEDEVEQEVEQEVEDELEQEVEQEVEDELEQEVEQEVEDRGMQHQWRVIGGGGIFPFHGT